jgi:hypothetical protein
VVGLLDGSGWVLRGWLGHPPGSLVHYT